MRVEADVDHYTLGAGTTNSVTEIGASQIEFVLVSSNIGEWSTLLLKAHHELVFRAWKDWIILSPQQDSSKR